MRSTGVYTKRTLIHPKKNHRLFVESVIRLGRIFWRSDALLVFFANIHRWLYRACWHNAEATSYQNKIVKKRSSELKKNQITYKGRLRIVNGRLRHTFDYLYGKLSVFINNKRLSASENKRLRCESVLLSDFLLFGDFFPAVVIFAEETTTAEDDDQALTSS